MKAQLVVGDGWKQIVFSPETEHDKTIARMLAETGRQNVEVKFGAFFHEQCQGGWYRQFDSSDALMFTLTPSGEPTL